MTAWILMVVFVGLGLLGVSEFFWASRLGNLVVFVTLISFYANAATDLDALTSAFAAIRAGRAHAQGIRNEEVGVDSHEELLRRIESMTELIHEHQLRNEERG
jgi:putative solute:sodium symporter small subunit